MSNFCDESSAVCQFREDVMAVGTKVMLLQIVFDAPLTENFRAV